MNINNLNKTNKINNKFNFIYNKINNKEIS
jgi:hypothetical protein